MEYEKCESCGKNNVPIDFDYKLLGNRICYQCKKIKNRAEEKERILTEENYSPFSTEDNGYYCPYCGEFLEIDDDYEIYEDGDHIAYCENCDSEFMVTTHVSYSYDSYKLEVKK